MPAPEPSTAVPDPVAPLPGDSDRHQLPRRTVGYWRLQNTFSGLVIPVAVVSTIAWFWTGLPVWVRVGAVVAAVLIGLFLVFGDPPLRYRRFWYAIGESEIDIEHGLLVITRTVVPMNRVQHLRMEHGPIADRFRLANLHIHTGAGEVSMRGLGRDEAEAIRIRVTELAHLSDDL